MNDRFTEKARNAIEKARAAAMELGHSYIGTEHLLLGIVRETDALGSRVLRENGFEEDLVMDLIEKAAGRGAPGMPVQGLTPRCRRVIEIAVAEANRLRHSYVGTEHLLMGILREPESTAAHLLTAAGGDLNKIYTDVFTRFTSSDYRAAARSGGVGQRTAVRHAETKNLDQYSRDLTEMASRGELDPVIGRDKEIARVIQILSRRSKNNPVLIGEPGVGKTAVAEGLAQRVAHGEVPENLRDKRIVSLDLTGMLAGTKYRGDFEDRLKNVLKEVGKAKDVVLFIDELHTVIGAGAAEGAIDAANILKPALSRGEIQNVGATTLSDPARPARPVRSAPRIEDHGRGAHRRGEALRAVYQRPVSPGQGDRPCGRGRVARAHGKSDRSGRDEDHRGEARNAVRPEGGGRPRAGL